MENTKAINILKHIQFFEGMEFNVTNVALNKAIKSLEAIDKITEIIKFEQQPTSCEYTKLKSFEMIEKIILTMN